MARWSRTPSQVLFERFAEEAALPVNRQSSEFKRSVRRNFWRNALAPLRALAFPIRIFALWNCREKGEVGCLQQSRALLVRLHSQYADSAAAPSAPESGNHQNEIWTSHVPACFMRVLHLNTHSSGGSHEYAVLLSTALAEQGIESQRALQGFAAATVRQTFLGSCYSKSVCLVFN